jgi:hypothetical protein
MLSPNIVPCGEAVRVGNNSSLRLSLVAIVLVHFAILLWHGAAHSRLAISLTAFQTAFVGLIIFSLPLIGTRLLWTNHSRAAARLIALSMFASLVFGLVNHFILTSPDHVAAVPVHPWRYSFVLSAALLVLTETIGIVLGTVAALA